MNKTYSAAFLIKSILALRPRQTIGQLARELRFDYDETKDEVTALYQRGEIEQFKTKLDKLVWQVVEQTHADGSAYEVEVVSGDHIPSFLKAMDDEREAKLVREAEQTVKDMEDAFQAVEDDEEEGGRRSGGMTLDMKPMEVALQEPVIPAIFRKKVESWRDNKAAPQITMAELRQKAMADLPPASMMAFDDWKKAIEDGKAHQQNKSKGGSK